VTLRRPRSAVALLSLDVSRGACGGVSTVTARGRFVTAAGRVRLQTNGPRTQVRVRCNAPDRGIVQADARLGLPTPSG
jgi:hypothetical protein